jgi:hypothetical protein
MPNHTVFKKIVTSTNSKIPINEFNLVILDPEKYKEDMIKEFEWFLSNIKNTSPSKYTLNFLLLLIGQTKCKEAFKYLCKMLRKMDYEQSSIFMGDFLVYDFPSILAATYSDNNDFNNLCQIVKDTNLPYDSRGAAILAIKILAKEKTISMQKINKFINNILKSLCDDPKTLISDFTEMEEEMAKQKTFLYHKMTLYILDLCIQLKLDNTIDMWKKLYGMNVLSKAIAPQFDAIELWFGFSEKIKSKFADSSTVVILDTIQKYSKYKDHKR